MQGLMLMVSSVIANGGNKEGSCRTLVDLARVLFLSEREELSINSDKIIYSIGH